MSESDRIDLRSDTVTRPSDRMREAARDAEVGDDVYREDPTVNELERRAADRLGKAAALYIPSGTMGNQVAARTHTERGQEVLVERESHVYKWELGGLAQHAEVQARTLDGGERGAIDPAAIRRGYVEADDHRPGTGLVCLENSHNSKGGVAIAPERIDAACEAAHERGVPVHLDGARLGNAAVAHDVSLARMARGADTAMTCLSKGLGAPVGSVLAGPDPFIERARRVRKLFGGGMRQGGMIAAPGLVALENVDRLAEDHANAERLATGFEAAGLDVTEPETNIVLVGIDGPAEQFLDRCEDRGVLGVPFGDRTVRFVTHLDVDRSDVETAVDRVADSI